MTPLFLDRLERLPPPEIADHARAMSEWRCLNDRARRLARAAQMRRDAGLPVWTGGRG